MTRPIDVRREVFPPLLALGLSLAFHSALLGLHPLAWNRDTPAEVDTVVVEYLPPPGSEKTGPSELARPAEEPKATAAAPQPATAPPAPSAQPTPKPENPPAGTASPAPPEKPPPPEVAEAPPQAPTPPPPEASSEAAPPPEAPAPATQPAPEEPAAPALSLDDLLPQRSDLERFAGEARLPDPTAPGAREATLSLRDSDRRYRSYLDSVHAAIDASEKWKEAVLMGGGGGVVVIRMTVNDLGQLENAEVARSSGRQLLDSAALEAVRNARIPPFPSHWRIERLHMDAQFNYQLVTY